MRRSKLGGWRKVLVLGLLGCFGFGVVLAMVGGALLWWAAATASELGDPTPVPTTLSVALEPVARLTTGTGGATVLAPVAVDRSPSPPRSWAKPRVSHPGTLER